MLAFRKLKITSLLVAAFLSFQFAASAQVEKIWPSWSVDDGTQFLANEFASTYTTSYMEYTYSGTGDFMMGFYTQANTLSGTAGMRFGFHYIASSSGFTIYYAGSAITGTGPGLNAGDVVRVKYSNDFFTITRNGVEVYEYAYSSGSYLPLYPYFNDPTNSGQEALMSYYRELLADQSPAWIANSQWRLAPNVLRRGEDGGVEMEYAGGTSPMHLRLQVSKNHDYAKYGITWMHIFPSSRQLYLFYRNVNKGHLQTGAWSNINMILTTDEFYPGAKVRLAREGANLVCYVNGEEKKRINTDANVDLHPVTYVYASNQEDLTKTTFAYEGGVCQNYFFSKGSYIDENTASNYYDAAATNENYNYVTSRTYDGEGESICHLLGESRKYFDDFGRPLQSQIKDMSNEKIWATTTLYDKLGRAAISTLAAPTGNTRIEYKDGFVLRPDGNPYGTADFEDNRLNDPMPVAAHANTLGDWYSSNNEEDPWQATTSYPYSRTEFSSITGAARRKTSPGDKHKMGAGKTTFTFSMPAGSELRYVFGDQHPMCLLAGDDTYDPNNQILNRCNANTYKSKYVKTIHQDADGRQIITFKDRKGMEVARAISGSRSNSTANLKNTTIAIAPGSFRDIHITKRNNFTTSVGFSGNGRNYTIYNLETDAVYATNLPLSTYAFPEGFYRVVNNNSEEELTLNYTLNYFDFSLNVYNLTGQLIASVAPNDVVYNVNNPGHDAYSYYRYNSLEQLIWEQTPDDGLTEYFYTHDGKIRFTVNAQQRLDGKVSFTKYDDLGRIYRTGEGMSSGATLANMVDDMSFPGSGAEQVTNYYDTPDPNFILAGYTQENIAGRISRAKKNGIEEIWYSYDEFGRTKWVARKILISNLDIKITEYSYDLVGTVTRVTYQKGQSDEFQHQYAYDIKGRLKSSATNQGGTVNDASKNQAQYEYTPDGQLSQTVLADGLETQTYAYTIHGQLKAINPNDMRSVDISSGGQHPFSMALHYYKDDYTPANGLWKETSNLPVNSASHAYNSYSGNITGSRWKTRAATGGVDLSGHFGYRYRYNHRNEMDWARFCNILPYSSNTYEGVASYSDDYYNLFTYDRNGNVNLQWRKGTLSATCSYNMDLLTYQYDPTEGRNRLTHIDDGFGATNCHPGELTDQDINNYSYNENGQLIRDVQENIFIEYYASGNVRRVYAGLDNSGPPIVDYYYGPDNKRIGKRVYQNGFTDTWYVYGGSSLQAIYQADCFNCVSELREVPIYGSKRHGVAYYAGGVWDYNYELSDHLGNVRAVIREGQSGELDIIQYADYYPYGWELPGRTFVTSNNYRFAFQGQFAERDLETGWTNFELRSYDARVGRWMSPDPYGQYHSPYLAFGNSPINNIDPDGGFVPLITGGVGALGGIAYGLFKGESFKKVLARGAGGFVAGFVAGTGVGLIGVAGGASSVFTATAANVVSGAAVLGTPVASIYITGFSALVGGLVGELAQQGIENLAGLRSGYNAQDIALSGILAIPGELFAGLVDEFAAGAIKSTISESLKKKIQKDLQKQVEDAFGGLLKKSEINELVEESTEIVLREQVGSLSIHFQRVDNSFDVTGSILITTTNEEIKSELNPDN